jgi:hypothetical protein
MLGTLLENRLFDIQKYMCHKRDSVIVTLMILIISLLTCRGEHRDLKKAFAASIIFRCKHS